MDWPFISLIAFMGTMHLLIFIAWFPVRAFLLKNNQIRRKSWIAGWQPFNDYEQAEAFCKRNKIPVPKAVIHFRIAIAVDVILLLLLFPTFFWLVSME